MNGIEAFDNGGHLALGADVWARRLVRLVKRALRDIDHMRSENRTHGMQNSPWSCMQCNADPMYNAPAQ